MLKLLKIVFSMTALVAIGVIITMFAMSSHSTVRFNPQPAAIGMATPVKLTVANPHGLRRVRVAVEQDGASATVMDTSQPATRFTFWRTEAPEQNLEFTVGKQQIPALKEGKARLVVEVQSNDLRALSDSTSVDVDVILQPPSLVTDGSQHYINQGGSELVLFTPSGSWNEAGVRVGDRSFRSFPVPGDAHQRFSLFAYSWDMQASTAPVVFAKNATGLEATATFWFKVFPKKFRARDLSIDDQFLAKVVNQIEPGASGDLSTRFLKINRETRQANNQALSDLRLKTEERFYWTKPFLQLANSQVESQFADTRTYTYNGAKVDQQVHLGFDLATVQQGPVIAANDGKVVWAKPLGIYGNCIVVDHGYGLQSIYGHLSEMAVQEGQTVARGEVMGKTGSTGLAGGDHLHFSMQVDGVQVNPVEWWDEHWIADHVWSRLKVH
jgi:murein DD-endopeptidase MepM/ murein hydrolase activator NlpD